MQTCRNIFDYFLKGKKAADSFGDEVSNKYLDAVSNGALKEGKKSPLDLTMDIVAETAVNGLLSNPASWLIQIISGVSQSVLMPLVRLSQGVVLGGPFTKAGKEAITDSGMMLYGAIQGFKEFAPFARLGFNTGLPIDIDFTRGMSKQERRVLLRSVGLSEDSSPEELTKFFRDRYDYMNKSFPGPFGEVVRFPTRMIVALDEGMKAVFRRQKYNAYAYRKAMEDTNNGTTGDLSEALQNYLRKDLAGEDAESAWKAIKTKDDSDLGELSLLHHAQDYAKLSAFQQELTGPITGLQKLRAENKALVLAIPFLKTPYNILKEGLTFVPGLGMIPSNLYKKAKSVVSLDALSEADKAKFLSLSGRADLTKAEQKTLGILRKKLGNQKFTKMEQSEMFGRQLLGFGALVTAHSLYDEGLITGKLPEDPAKREQWRVNQIPEFSIRVGDEWVSYRKIEPLATVFGLISDQHRIYDEVTSRFANPNADQIQEYMNATHASLIENVMGKSFMEGLSGIVELMSGGAAGTASGGIESFMANLGRVAMPFGAFLNSVAISMDSENAPNGKAWDRQATTFFEKMQQRLPVFRESLPLMYGIYGEARKLDIVDVWSGIKTYDDTDRTELQEQLGALSVAYSPIDRTIKESMRLNNDELGQLRQIAAETITPLLEDMISAPAWRTLPESTKNEVFERVMRSGRRDAMKLFIAKNIGSKEFEARYMNAIFYNKNLQDIVSYMPE